MTIAEKVIKDNKDCNIFEIMDKHCPSDYGFSDNCGCNVFYDEPEGQSECLMCWTREIEEECKGR